MPESKKAEATVSIIVIDGYVIMESEGHRVTGHFKTRHPQVNTTVTGKATMWHDGWESLTDRMSTLRTMWMGGRDLLFEFKRGSTVIARIEFVVDEGDFETLDELCDAWVPLRWD